MTRKGPVYTNYTPARQTEQMHISPHRIHNAMHTEAFLSYLKKKFCSVVCRLCRTFGPSSSFLHRTNADKWDRPEETVAKSDRKSVV